MGYLCGVDIGGTFTNAVIIDPDGRVTLAKSPSTPNDFARGFFAALAEGARALGLSLEQLLAKTELLSHGTTVATNVVVERRGAKVGLIATAGHGDAILIMRAHGRAAGLSPAETLRFAATAKPTPMVPRSLVREVAERVDVNGAVVVALDESAVEVAARELLAAGCEAIAIAFLWSFRNPAHERRAQDIVRRVAPDCFVTCSHEIAPQLGEYERTVAAVLNCYVGPVTSAYVERLASRARDAALGGPLLLMQCNGGLATVEDVRESPLLLLQSGPCGGVVGAAALGRELGYRNLIATNMGGTTFDVGLVHDGQALRGATTTVHQYEFFVPALAVKSVGAGGGSIAWVDPQRGALSVGPRSAGAQPGPVSYRRGGVEPTVTDADLVLGYIDADYFLGGRERLDHDAAWRAVAALGVELGLDPWQTAAGINRIADEHMAGLIRRETIEKGLDPRDFVLFSYGGAGPCHAGAYARELGVRKVIVPLASAASVWSAFGVASSDVVHVQSRDLMLVAPFDMAALRAGVAELRAQADARFAAEGFGADLRRYAWSADVRHRLQVHVVEVPFTPEMPDAALATALIEDFTARYEGLYGVGTAYRDAGVELVSLRLTASAALTKPALEQRPLGPAAPPLDAVAPSRAIYWPERGARIESAIYRAAALLPGNVMAGPAVIESTITTIVVRPGQTASVDAYGNIVIELATGDAA